MRRLDQEPPFPPWWTPFPDFLPLAKGAIPSGFALIQPRASTRVRRRLSSRTFYF